MFTLFLGMLSLLFWIFWAGPRWWWPIPVAVTFGGFFYFGFKIYLYEMALPLCGLAFLPAVALRRTEFMQKRMRLPLSVWLLVALFMAEWLVGFFALKSQGIGGGGSLSRIYLQGLWPLCFLMMFYRYGDSRYLRTALVLMYIACIVRVIVATFAFFATDLLLLPYLNFVFSSSLGGIGDFRYSGIQLLLLGLCFAHISRGKSGRIFNLAMAIVAAGLILLGGGRVSVGMLCIIPLFWGLLFRRMGALSVASFLILIVVVFLNQQPQVIYRFPPSMQRALSILVRESPGAGLDWHETLRSSNEWHSRLGELGCERWLGSPVTFLFGARAEPFDDNFESFGASMEIKAQVAAKMGLYESGLWTVLGLTGVCGMLIYGAVFWYLLKDVALSLWKTGMSTPAHVIGLIAIAQITLWVLFCWIAGGFPSQELLMAILARFAWEDARSQPDAQPLIPVPARRQ